MPIERVDHAVSGLLILAFKFWPSNSSLLIQAFKDWRLPVSEGFSVLAQPERRAGAKHSFDADLIIQRDQPPAPPHVSAMPMDETNRY